MRERPNTQVTVLSRASQVLSDRDTGSCSTQRMKAFSLWAAGRAEARDDFEIVIEPTSRFRRSASKGVWAFGQISVRRISRRPQTSGNTLHRLVNPKLC